MLEGGPGGPAGARQFGFDWGSMAVGNSTFGVELYFLAQDFDKETATWQRLPRGEQSL